MARAGLGLELRAAIRQARKEWLPVRKEGVLLQANGGPDQVDLEVIPLQGGVEPRTASPNEAYFLVLFENPRFAAPPGDSKGPALGAKNANVRRVRGQDLRLKHLELELAATKGDMQSIIEKAEASNAELNAANEEILSSNEELQSVNEELESSKEELQSSNEELTTLNQELQTRNEQLKEARDYSEAIVQTVREPLLILGGDLRVRSANAAFYQTFKVSPEDTVGCFIDDLGDGQWNLNRLRPLLNEVLRKNQVMQDFEVDAEFPAIGHKVMLLNARRIYAKGNHEDLILLAIEEITERRALEQRKDEFVARTAHELKTPVTTIQGYSDLLTQRLQEGSDDRARLYGSKLATQLEHLTLLINDLLDASRMQTGKLELQREEFSPDQLAKEVVADMQIITPNRRIVFEGRTKKKVWGDRQRISQVLVNLLTNALKFSPPEAKVLVRTAASRDGVTVSVQDFGIGISNEDQDQLFQRFFQAKDPKARKIGGMGLGLYISAGIIERHGGKIWVESQKGKGTTFSFRLPYQ
jgi:two-component system CheB/CheR fusion protein